MSRVQLALNVTDIDAAVEFYSKLFATEPAKRKPGYANFAIADPPLKLVLFEGTEGGTINHLGVETETGDQVLAAEARLADEGLTAWSMQGRVALRAVRFRAGMFSGARPRAAWHGTDDDHPARRRGRRREALDPRPVPAVVDRARDGRGAAVGPGHP